MKDCKVAGFKCVKSGESKKECFINATKCIKSCFAKKEADDELLFGDEPVKESKDKCVRGYDACVKENGSDWLSRFNCGMGYLKCRFMGSKDEDLMFDDADSKITDKIESYEKKEKCFDKCKYVVAACLKKGKSASDKKKCLKIGFACVKKCLA